MIAHVLFLKPHPDLTPEERQSILDELVAASKAIPSVRSLRVGRRVKHGLPGYEQMMREDFEYSLIFEFDDLEGLKSYLTHPQHVAIGRHFTQSAAAALAYDYDMEEWT
jgi:hypothetical protein